jgi:hypothetical protein
MKIPVYIIILLFLFSCTSIQQAVVQRKPVSFKVENNTNRLNGNIEVYTAEIKYVGGEYEFHVRRGTDSEIYFLPSNKLSLLYGMEMAFKDIKRLVDHRYTRVTVTANKSKRIHEINTDLVANFISGLKKK